MCGGCAWTTAWKFVPVRSTVSSWTARCEFHSEVSRSKSRVGAVCSVALRPSAPRTTAPRLATGPAAMSRRRRPEPVTMSVCPARCGAGSGRSRGSAFGKRPRTSMGQPMHTEMLPAAPSPASIEATRRPPSPMETRMSSRLGNGSPSAMKRNLAGLTMSGAPGVPARRPSPTSRPVSVGHGGDEVLAAPRDLRLRGRHPEARLGRLSRRVSGTGRRAALGSLVRPDSLAKR